MLRAGRWRGGRDSDYRQSEKARSGARRLRPHRSEGACAPSSARIRDVARRPLGSSWRRGPVASVRANVSSHAREETNRIRDSGRAAMVPRRPNVLPSKMVRLDLSVLSDAASVQRRKGPLDPDRGSPPAPPRPVPSGGPRVPFRSRELGPPLNYSLHKINKASLDESLWYRDRSALGAPLLRSGPSGVHRSGVPSRRPRGKRGSDGHPVERRQRGSSLSPWHTPRF